MTKLVFNALKVINWLEVTSYVVEKTRNLIIRQSVKVISLTKVTNQSLTEVLNIVLLIFFL